jgi:hypothetical protein
VIRARAAVEIPTTQRLYAALLQLDPVVIAAHLPGDRMSKSEIYRHRAQECLKLADKFTFIEIQGCLLSMAYAWWRLAELAPVLLESADDGKLAARD